MISRIKKHIERYNLINSGDTLIVGVSGGADSVCLLCVLWKLYKESDVKIKVVHINHGIRETALRDQQYVESICMQMNIPCKSIKVDVNKYANERGLSTEEAGRMLRYEAFASEMTKEGNYKIAVAHNMDDNSETMLLNMFRGSGLRGLAGIPVTRDKIIRPLLCVRRHEIEKYLKEQNMQYMTDETNLTDDYTRNKIRHNVIPYVCENVNEKAVERMEELSENVALAEEYIEAVVSEKVLQCTVKSDNGVLINKDSFDALHTYIKRRVILEVLGNICGTKKDIMAVHIKDVENLFDLQVGKSICLPYGMVAKRVYEGVIMRQGSFPCPTNQTQLTQGNDPCPTKQAQGNDPCPVSPTWPVHTAVITREELNEKMSQGNDPCPTKQTQGNDPCPTYTYTKWLDYDKIQDGYEVRTRKEGDYIVIDDAGNKQKLKSYFVNNKIPSELRDTIPLVAKGSEIIWIVGYRISAAYKLTDSTKNVLEISFDIDKE